MSTTLFISDLDGTLLNADSKVSDASVSLINEAVAKGALFSIATARTPATVSTLMSRIQTQLPYIVMTGTAIWDASSGLYRHAVFIDPRAASGIMRILRRHRLPAFVYYLKEETIQVYHMGPLSGLERDFIRQRDNTPYKIFHIPEDGESVLPDTLDNILLFYAIQPSASVEAVYREICLMEGCNPLFYHDIFGSETGIMDIFSTRASKALAMEWLKRSCGADRVVAFGDNINDLPMLRAADVAVAVGNALPEVKAAADIVIGPNTEDSVARFVYDHIDGDISL